jgi:hypothetical protein
MSVNPNFVNALKKWASYDKEIKQQNLIVKNLKDKKEELESALLKYMENNNLTNTQLTLSGHNINYNKILTPASLSIKIIEEVLSDYLNNQSDVVNICNNIKQKRFNNNKVQVSLKKKVIKERRSKSKSKSYNRKSLK